MKTRQSFLTHLSILMFMVVLFCFAASPAFSDLPVEVPPGYMIEEVCPNYIEDAEIAGIPGFGVAPTSIDFGRRGELYISFMSGEIVAMSRPNPYDCQVNKLTTLEPPNAIPIAIGVHPHTGELYVAHGYYIGDDITDPDKLKSKIAILDSDTGTLTTFIDGLNSMLFDAIPFPTVGTQGFDWDNRGNIYWAQGINSASAWRWENCQDGSNADPRCDNFVPTDEWQSAIMMADPQGNVSVFSPGHRSPYDVAVGKQSHGKALYIYAGDNGEGEECADASDEGGIDPADERDCAEGLAYEVNQLIEEDGIELREEYLGYVNSAMYWDELNRVWPGKHYGWPGGFSGEPRKTHIGALWNLDKVNRLDETGEEPRWDWWVPAGIEYIDHVWRGEIKNPVFLASWGTRTGPYDDVGAVEMFWGDDMQNRLTLVKYLDGAIDVRMAPDGKLYVAEFKTGKIYRVWPIRGGQ